MTRQLHDRSNIAQLAPGDAEVEQLGILLPSSDIGRATALQSAPCSDIVGARNRCLGDHENGTNDCRAAFGLR
jgi:hypothetical protein